MGYNYNNSLQDADASEKFRNKASNSKALTYIPYIDSVLGKIIPGEFVILMADSGVGKTDLLFSIAQKNSFNGVNTLLIALESFNGENNTRFRFKKIASTYYKERRHFRQGYIFYDRWIKREYTHLQDLELLVMSEFMEQTDSLTVVYKDADGFNYDDFEKLINETKGQYGLICLDHLHYFDIRGDNANKEEGYIAKKIKALAESCNIPVIAAAHINKTREKGQLVYDKESIMGSSDIYKNATTIISVSGLSHDKLEPLGLIASKPDVQFWTTFRICKGRYYGQTKDYIGLHLYDLTEGDYKQEKATILKLKNKETELELTQKEKLPSILKIKELENYKEEVVDDEDVVELFNDKDNVLFNR